MTESLIYRISFAFLSSLPRHFYRFSFALERVIYEREAKEKRISVYFFGLFSFFRAFSESKVIASSFVLFLTFSLLRISGWCGAFRERVE